MEKFTEQQTIIAIEQFLEYGEQQFGKSQQGYFSGVGWAARCLNAHRERLLTLYAPDRFQRGWRVRLANWLINLGWYIASGSGNTHRWLDFLKAR